LVWAKVVAGATPQSVCAADDWIDSAIERALGVVADAGLDIRIVSRGGISPSVQKIGDRW
jgi:hypothetical protein